ncbi:MAG: RNA polymerase subunit sigma, partial [Betaproteobacteria bacterium]|nr:RNA polymerase subunit sigma [Betaproteobacteria bacterium]
RAALAALAPHYRDVAILYEMHDLSYVEIAQVCNIDIGTVRSRLNRARTKLVAMLSLDGEESPVSNQTKKEARS